MHRMADAKLTIQLQDPIGRINPNLYGHFSEHLGTCINEGLWVGEESPTPNVGGIRSDAVAALRRISPPVLRWPGGCFADDYHWEDGVGPRKDRPRRVNVWWGETIEDNCFGTQEFISLCRAIGAQPYIAGNLGSGSPREMRDWVEYCNFSGDSTLARRRTADGSPSPLGVRFWGVGNENWGCGGHFSPEDYAVEYKRYSTYLRDFGGNPLFLIACGPCGNDPEWTRRFFTELGTYRRIHGLAAHYYCGTAGTATEYSVDQWYELIHRSLAMERLILQHRAIMDGFDPERKIGLVMDEWGTWHPPTPGRNPHHLWQQNTLRDALVAAATLNIFNRHADKVVMANIAQTVNVLQSLLLTDGAKLALTPTYHVFDMYQNHQGGQSLRLSIESEEIAFRAGAAELKLPELNASASVKDNVLTLSVVNTHAQRPVEAGITLQGGRFTELSVSELTHKDIHAHNTFDAPQTLKPRNSLLGLNGTQWHHTFSPASVTVFRAVLG